METLVFVLGLALWPLCLAMVGLILLQGGAGDISSAFGGGGMLDSQLGVGASKKMAKVTGWMAAGFFLIVLFLAIPKKGGLESLKPVSPVTPAAPAVTPAPAPAAAAPAALAPAPVVEAPAAIQPAATAVQSAAAEVKAVADTVVAPVAPAEQPR